MPTANEIISAGGVACVRYLVCFALLNEPISTCVEYNTNASGAHAGAHADGTFPAIFLNCFGVKSGGGLLGGSLLTRSVLWYTFLRRYSGGGVVRRACRCHVC